MLFSACCFVFLLYFEMVVLQIWSCSGWKRLQTESAVLSIIIGKGIDSAPREGIVYRQANSKCQNLQLWSETLLQYCIHAHLLATELAREMCSTFRFFAKDGSRVETKMQNFISILISPKIFQTSLFSQKLSRISSYCFLFFAKIVQISAMSNFFKPTREFATLFTSVFARICKITCHQNIFPKIVPFFARICKISCYQNIFTIMVPSSSMLLTNVYIFWTKLKDN